MPDNVSHCDLPARPELIRPVESCPRLACLRRWTSCPAANMLALMPRCDAVRTGTVTACPRQFGGLALPTPARHLASKVVPARVAGQAGDHRPGAADANRGRPLADALQLRPPRLGRLFHRPGYRRRYASRVTKQQSRKGGRDHFISCARAGMLAAPSCVSCYMLL